MTANELKVSWELSDAEGAETEHWVDCSIRHAPVPDGVVETFVASLCGNVREAITRSAAICMPSVTLPEVLITSVLDDIRPRVAQHYSPLDGKLKDYTISFYVVLITHSDRTRLERLGVLSLRMLPLTNDSRAIFAKSFTLPSIWRNAPVCAAP